MSDDVKRSNDEMCPKEVREAISDLYHKHSEMQTLITQVQIDNSGNAERDFNMLTMLKDMKKDSKDNLELSRDTASKLNDHMIREDKDRNFAKLIFAWIVAPTIITLFGYMTWQGKEMLKLHDAVTKLEIANKG